MPLITENKSKDVQFRVRMKQEVLDEVNEYIDWAGLSSINVFLEQAALYVLQKDKDWKQAKNQTAAKE